LKQNTSPYSHQTELFENTPIFTLLLKLALPMAIGMIINSLYTIVDAIFIAQFIGQHAFASVSTVFPLQICIASVAIMISNGASVLLSQTLGKNDLQKIHAVMHSATRLVLILSLMIAFVTLVSGSSLLKTLQVPAILQHDALTYFQVMAVGSIFVLSLSLLCDVLRSLGKMKELVFVIAVGAITNIIADYLFIVEFSWGVLGAAYASLLSQFISLILALFFLKKCHFLHYFGIKNNSKTSEILRTGLPVLIMYIGGALTMLVCNYNISHYTAGDPSTVLAAYGVIGRLNIFISLPLIAIANACQTATAFNYGANHLVRVKSSIKYGLLIALGYLLLITLGLFSMTENILGLFHNDAKILATATIILTTVFLLLPLAAIGTIFTASMQATGQPGKALLFSFAKVYLLLLPLLIFLPSLGYFQSMWYIFPTVDAFMFSVVVIFVFIKYKKFASETQMEVAK